MHFASSFQLPNANGNGAYEASLGCMNIIRVFDTETNEIHPFLMNPTGAVRYSRFCGARDG